MKRRHLALAPLLLLVAVTLSLGSAGAGSPKGNPNHKPALHRADCAHLATTTDVVGFAILESDGSGDLQIQVSLKQGMPRTEYKAFLLASPCTIIFADDILTTNKKGKGNLHMMVPTASIPAGTTTVAVQLVSPPSAMVPGPGPFTDVITSDFVTPKQASEAAEHGRF
jgi:hypothetical protein